MGFPDYYASLQTPCRKTHSLQSPIRMKWTKWTLKMISKAIWLSRYKGTSGGMYSIFTILALVIRLILYMRWLRDRKENTWELQIIAWPRQWLERHGFLLLKVLLNKISWPVPISLQKLWIRLEILMTKSSSRLNTRIGALTEFLAERAASKSWHFLKLTTAWYQLSRCLDGFWQPWP